jgi:hypothetical protein
LTSLRRLKQNLPDLQIVLVQDTGVDATAVAEAAGADAALNWPVKRSELIRLFGVADVDQ